MRRTSDYIALKNFLHNELGLTKDQIKKIAIKAVEEEAKSIAQRALQQNSGSFVSIVEEQTKREVIRLLSGNSYNSNSREVMQAIGTEIAKQIKIEVKS